jgi:class 3 adenylate cyclase/predicted ATPase
MDVMAWLRSHGLEQYEAAFRENAVDESILPRLTAEDLKDLGVTAVGHRRKLLEAIAELRDAKAEPLPSEPSSTLAALAKDTAAERRHVTVMFSDLVGSTALSARMDPEDLREIISAYQQCVADAVGRFGGFVAKYMGDGVLIYFGYPQAQEDDAERAVRAALGLVKAVSGLKTHAPLHTRVGIATGLVVVGDLIGSGASQEQAIVGETPNLAARLQGVAEPNSVVIADSTRNLVGNLFELGDLGAQDLKGIAGPVKAWAALRTAAVEGRFEAFHGAGLTKLVGREEELELLVRRWSKAKAGEGQLVLLSGEPGIGKSRLTAALMEHVSGEPHTRLRYFCSPQSADSALYPISSQMERAAGFKHDDNVRVKLDKVDALLAQSSTSPQDATLLIEMLSLPNDGRYPKVELAPQQRRQKTMEALTAQIEALSRSSPVLMIFEDVHWIDPTSLEALGHAVNKISILGVLLIVTHRPEFQPPWTGQPYVTALTVNRLGRREIDSLIERVIGDKPLPEKLKQDIVERTDGVPLFVEEMTKAVLEAESDERSQRVLAATPSSSIVVPASLHASLMARLDRLGPAKEIAQIGAAIGREFSYALLAVVVSEPERNLQSALDRLTAAGLLFRQGTPPHATYLFKHALVQDAAYGTLLRGPRRALHARIAEAIEQYFADIAEGRPELLARHYSEAGAIERAASLWSKAGQRSLERSALVEASEQLVRAGDLMASLPSTAALRREQIKLQVNLITPLMQVKGHAAPETVAAAERAHFLISEAEGRGETLEDPLLLFSVLYGFWATAHAGFQGTVMRELATQFLTLAERQGATVPLLVGHRLMGSSLTLTGDIQKGRAHYDQAITLYDAAAHGSLITRFGQDLEVANLSFRSLALWLLGYPLAAESDNNEAIRYAREIGHPASLMLALTYKNLVAVFLTGNYPSANTSLNEVASIAEKSGALMWKVAATFTRGYVTALTGKPLDGLPLIETNVAVWQSAGAKMFRPLLLAYTARAYLDAGKFDAALQSIQDAIAAIQTTGERWVEAEVNRVAGEIAERSLDPDTINAEAYFHTALQIAHSQQAKSWELRAAMSLARLWRDQGKVRQSRELLAPVYGWFTEGFDTRDLKEAKALLKELPL